MRPSIKQVAHLAGVSIATVSRLLNKPGSVSAETAEKIHRSIAELGFRPNFTGRNLRAGNSRTVGVVVPTLSNTVFAQCLQGIELAARALDYSVMFTTTEYLPEDESAAVELLLGHRVDGVILTVADAGANATLDLLERERIPFVLAYNQLADAAADAAADADAEAATHRASVSVDNRAAACDAVSHLIGLGHRRIQMLSGRFNASDRAMQRYCGYLDAMQAAGLAPLPAIEVERHTLTAATDYQQMMADPLHRPTALFCSNDLLALSAMRDLRALGLQVPEDISVMGFDGIPVGALMQPVLASVVQPSEQIGDVALRTLVDAIERALPAAAAAAAVEEAPVPVIAGVRHILPHTLREGGSVAPPAPASC
ncbi:LacI family DNA-binding transcriptional regulator [Herbaspirillum huttiense F1]|uniref:LacI family DNA-binding transcriptional regulator n=1 Tax=Herbaspirillum huttiense subsp. lycopersici TaxID=3074428 RepID=A0ABU2EQL9_9BURK|nr:MULTISPECIES: LacI family DNA-binding transcriptional regulator [Herbaspirillum]MDR6742138.1 DNA-binding LacI/PurR family transcriptional regulator [Herbaspirillum sp. 1173]MDR9850455.1 LacI family DNA-binding transcriptional regulator [Herbaspirillum huttiense SE1]MDT0357735.1 LacI family DNA-binding transcriptional regulator [Herbaspirillum huttiense F1]